MTTAMVGGSIDLGGTMVERPLILAEKGFGASADGLHGEGILHGGDDAQVATTATISSFPLAANSLSSEI